MRELNIQEVKEVNGGIPIPAGYIPWWISPLTVSPPKENPSSVVVGGTGYPSTTPSPSPSYFQGPAGYQPSYSYYGDPYLYS